jgi:hypothetical protein
MDIVARAKNILLSPNAEWPVIAAEPTTVKALYNGYIVPLTAIGPICSFIALVLFFGGIGVGAALISSILIFAVNLVSTYILALIAQALAPSFDGRADIVGALKLIAYSYTPVWIGGILNLIPMLGIIELLLALYGFYLIYAGAPEVVNVPREKAAIFTIVLVVAMIVIFLLASWLLGTIAGTGRIGMMG